MGGGRLVGEWAGAAGSGGPCQKPWALAAAIPQSMLMPALPLSTAAKTSLACWYADFNCSKPCSTHASNTTLDEENGFPKLYGVLSEEGFLVQAAP